MVDKIANFPQDNRIWRVEWMRAIEQNPNVYSEPTIQVIIARFKSSVEKEYNLNPNSRLFCYNKDVEVNRVIKIGIGQFPLVNNGMLWRNGFCVGDNVGKKVSLKLNINDKTVKYTKGFHKDLFEDENGIHESQILTTHNHNISTKGVYSECASIEYKDDPFGVIMPITTLINFYYCPSTVMALAIFNGDIQHNLNKIINTEESCVDEAQSLSSLKLRADVPDEDSWIISRILYTDEGFRGATLVHDSLMAQQANMNYHWLYPKSQFPFSGKTTLEVYGKYIKCEIRDTWRFLVFDIISCSAPFPFKRQEVIRDNSGEKADPNTDIPDEDKKDAYPKKNQKSNSKNPSLSNEEEPSNFGNIKQIIKPSKKFRFLTGKEIEKPQKEFCRYKSAKVKTAEDLLTDKLGTGDGTYGDTETQKARVVAREKALKATFDNFVTAINQLNSLDGYEAKILSNMPNTSSIPLTRSPQYFQWSYLNSKDKLKRGVIIAEVIKYMDDVDNEYYYMIDFSSRPNEKCQMGIVNNDSYGQIGHELIYSILLKLTDAKGRWGNIKSLPGTLDEVKTMKHSWVSKDAFCKTFISKIIRK